MRHKKQQDDWRQAQADAAHLSEQQYKRVAASEEACKREREISYTLPRVSRAGIIGAPPRSVPVRCATDGDWDSQSGHIEPPPPGLTASQVLRHGESMTPPKGDARQWPALVATPGGLHSRTPAGALDTLLPLVRTGDFPGLDALPPGQLPRPGVKVQPGNVPYP